MSFDWKSMIKSVAPMIGTALGGPFGGAATKMLLNVLDPAGKTDPNSDSDVSKLVSDAMGDLNKVAQIQQAEQQFKLQMAQLGFQNEKDLADIAFEDRSSARNREIQVRDWTPKVLGFLITMGFFGILIFMLKWDIPDKSRDVLNIMLGALGTAWISVVTYYFGSSAGSDKKTDLLADKGGQS
jgi:hypothetical protein